MQTELTRIVQNSKENQVFLYENCTTEKSAHLKKGLQKFCVGPVG